MGNEVETIRQARERRRDFPFSPFLAKYTKVTKEGNLYTFYFTDDARQTVEVYLSRGLMWAFVQWLLECDEMQGDDDAVPRALRLVGKPARTVERPIEAPMTVSEDRAMAHELPPLSAPSKPVRGPGRHNRLTYYAQCQRCGAEKARSVGPQCMKCAAAQRHQARREKAHAVPVS